MPKTREIPSAEWPAFLDAFSRLHQGWRTRVEVLGREFGAQEETGHLPLMGIATDARDPRRQRITITLGRSPDDHVSHAVDRPSKIFVERTDEGADQALEIESANGTTTLLRFLDPALPETVNGTIPQLENQTQPEHS